jgi:hypothetical protein
MMADPDAEKSERAMDVLIRMEKLDLGALTPVYTGEDA